MSCVAKLISGCTPQGNFTPNTLSLPRASTHKEATTELSTPPPTPIDYIEKFKNNKHYSK